MAALLDTTELLGRLVAFDTVSRSTDLPLVDFLADYLDRPGVTLARDAYRDPAGVEKASLVVRVGPPAEPATRAGLVLSGHLDVVPADEPEWSSDPFTLSARDGRLYGRGSADMKGFVGLAANAAARLDPASLRAPLVLLLTCDEEVGTLGARHLCDAWGELEPKVGPLPTSALIGEPTELAVVRMHKGHLKFRVETHGRSAHSAYPHLGENAIEGIGPVIQALARLGRELATERPPHGEHFPGAPSATLNQGTIRGGSALNVVPDLCVLEGGVRLLPGMDATPVAERLRRAVAEAAGAHRFEVSGESPPLLTAPEAPLHRALCEITGSPGDGAVSYATDAGWLQQLGLDCVVWGPGSIEVAHRPDEFVEAADLERAAGPLGELIERFCGGEGGAA